MPHRILEINEVAHYLNLVPSEVERLVRDHEIPFERHGSRLVFRKVEIDSWASPRVLSMDERRLRVYHRTTAESESAPFPSQAPVTELLLPEAIEPAMPAKTKASVIREMVKVGARTGRVCDVTELVAQLAAREDVTSTGLPGGLALLHPRSPEDWLFESAFLALGRAIQKIPFGAPDGRPTDLFFLVACPDPRLHLLVLARLCFMAQQTAMLEDLRGATTAEEMQHCIAGAEQEALAKAASRQF